MCCLSITTRAHAFEMCVPNSQFPPHAVILILSVALVQLCSLFPLCCSPKMAVLLLSMKTNFNYLLIFTST